MDGWMDGWHDTQKIRLKGRWGSFEARAQRSVPANGKSDALSATSIDDTRLGNGSHQRRWLAGWPEGLGRRPAAASAGVGVAMAAAVGVFCCFRRVPFFVLSCFFFVFFSRHLGANNQPTVECCACEDKRNRDPGSRCFSGLSLKFPGRSQPPRESAMWLALRGSGVGK